MAGSTCQLPLPVQIHVRWKWKTGLYGSRMRHAEPDLCMTSQADGLNIADKKAGLGLTLRHILYVVEVAVIAGGPAGVRIYPLGNA